MVHLKQCRLNPTNQHGTPGPRPNVRFHVNCCLLQGDYLLQLTRLATDFTMSASTSFGESALAVAKSCRSGGHRRPRISCKVASLAEWQAFQPLILSGSQERHNCFATATLWLQLWMYTGCLQTRKLDGDETGPCSAMARHFRNPYHSSTLWGTIPDI